MCVCSYLWVYVCDMWVCVCVCSYLWVYVCAVWVWVCVCVFISVSVCVCCVCMGGCAYVWMHACLCMSGLRSPLSFYHRFKHKTKQIKTKNPSPTSTTTTNSHPGDSGDTEGWGGRLNTRHFGDDGPGILWKSKRWPWWPSTVGIRVRA